MKGTGFVQFGFALVIFFALPIVNSWLSLNSATALADAGEKPYAKWLALAKSERLWERHEWRVLLHYYLSSIHFNDISAVDDPAFFLAVNGKTSPESELEATISALFNDGQKHDKAVACRFPARSEWLIRTLEIPATQLPHHQCQALNQWLDKLQADSVSLIFPVSIFNSPASLFGHTFIRFNKEQHRQPDLLALTVNYAAHTEHERGVGFALKGLFGGYQGKFSLAPYYSRVKEYSDLESRDIWEYQLNFAADETHRLTLHLWEVLPVFFDYYFVDENCAYQLLALLQAARPSLALTEPFRWDAIPTDTIRSLTHVPQLVKAVHYRPSARTKILARSNAMSAQARQRARELSLGEMTILDPRLTHLDPPQQAKILELAYHYALYMEAGEKSSKTILWKASPVDRTELLHSLLTARSRLPVASQSPRIPVPEIRPDQGHHSHRAALRYGYEEPKQFIETEFRWAYHDLFDPSGGFAEGAQLEFLKTALRYYPESQKFDFEGLEFVNILSAPSFDFLLKPISWKFSAEIKRYRFDSFFRPLLADFKAGVGISYPVSRTSRLLLFADAEAAFSDHFNQYAALGGGADISLLTSVNERWLVGLSAEVKNYFQGITQTSYQLSMKQRISIGVNQAVVIEAARAQEFGSHFFKAHLSWQLYF